MVPPKPDSDRERNTNGQHPLSLRLADDAVLIDLEHSFGPVLCLAGNRFAFDARKKSSPQIGLNASPLFGVAHSYANWIDDSSDQESIIVDSAHHQLLHRKSQDPFATAHALERHQRYVVDSLIDQYPEQVTRVIENIQTNLPQIAETYSDQIQSVGGEGLEFWLQFKDLQRAAELVQSSVAHGLLISANSDQALFALHMGYRDSHLQLFWQQVRRWLDSAPPLPLTQTLDPKVQSSYRFHRQLLKQKLTVNESSLKPTKSAIPFLREELGRQGLGELTVDEIHPENYQSYRQQILDMQALVYEPARQTPPEEFDSLFDPNQLRFQDSQHSLEREPLGIAVLEGSRIVAMAFAGPLDLFTCERGVSDDPYLDDPLAYYMVDLTVVQERRGSLGRLMKNALTMLALEKGVTAIHGRNRDRWARGMWAINLSLGSFEIQHLENDYPDDDQFRDCIYYRCPLSWDSKPTQISWSDGVRHPLTGLYLPNNYLRDRLPEMIHGTLDRSTFTLSFLKELSYVTSYWPEELRIVQATCHPDRVLHYTTQLVKKLGDAQSTIAVVRDSNYPIPPDVNVVWIDHPRHVGKIQYLNQLEQVVGNQDVPCRAVVLEPIGQSSHDTIPADILEQSVQICRNRRIPIVFDESASIMYRHGDWFTPSGNPDSRPDLVIATLGSGFAIVLGQRKHQSNSLTQAHTNLMNLFGFAELLRQVHRDHQGYLDTVNQFNETIGELLDKQRFQIERGIGWIEGELPQPLNGKLRQSGARFLICPSWIQMRTINSQLGSS